MVVYRLSKEKYIRDLSGTGARLYGGRWNRKGTPMLYTSEHSALALLELIVHTPQNLLPDTICLLKLRIPDEFAISTFEQKHLPKNWRQYPAPNSLADSGTTWINNRKSVGLSVPSVIIPDAWNILLNPDHGAYQKISIKSVSPFQLDSRF